MSTPSPHSNTNASNAYADGCAWIEGQYLPIGEARIPINDTGFTRSDCTYDVVSVWNGRFLRLDDHLERFAKACDKGRFAPPLKRPEIRAVLMDCVRHAGLRDAYVEMIVTRGVPPAGERNPKNFPNRFYAFAIPYVWVATPEQQAEGLDLVVARQSRRIAPTSVDPTMKNFHWGDFNRALFEANDRAAQHVVLVNDEGAITEGPGFNVFALKDGVLHTPASGVLLGITRKTVIQLAEQQGTEVRIADFDESVLLDADEIFLTSTAGGVMPVTHIEKRPLGDGRPGPFATAIRKAYWDAHAFDEWSTAVDYPDNGT